MVAMTRRLAALVLAVAFAIPLAAPRLAGAAEADFADHYRAGLAAAEAGNWRQVETAMRQAIAGRSAEDGRLLKLGFKRYLPHFYLGRARFELGDCEGALAAWAESERQGVLARQADEKRIVEQGRATCRERAAAVAALDKAKQTARQSLDRAGSAKKALDERRSELEAAGVWAAGSPSIGTRFAAASRNLDTAARRFASGERLEIDQAARLADDVSQELAAITAEADRLAGEASAARSSVRERLTRAVADARRAITSLAFLEPFPPELARRRAEVEQAARRAESLPANASAEDIDAAARELATSSGRLRRAANAPPDALVSSAEAYFAGDYAKVVSLLSLIDQNEPRATAHALLLRSAARYALYILGGEKDSQLLIAAKTDARTAATTDRTLAPLPTAFPPRYLELFRAEAGINSP